MSAYQITFARSARRELEALHVSVAERILSQIERLAQNPRPSGCKKLRGSNKLWRIKIGEYRVVYDINDKNKIVDIVVIRHRRDAYR